MMKDKCGGEQILEFAGLRAKMSSYRLNKTEEKKGKGVKKNVIRKDISFSDYYNCLVERVNPIYRKMNLIRSHEFNRFLLSSFVGALYRPPWPFLNITH